VTVYEKSLITMLACAAVFALVALPLALRRVGRNRIYGFRTTHTLSDDAVWFEVNAAFGKALLVASVVTAVFEVALWKYRWFEGMDFIHASLAGLVVPLIAAALYGQLVSRSLRSP